MARGAPRSYNLDLFTDEAAVAAGARLEPWPNTRRFPLNVDHHQVQEQVLGDLRGSECKTGTDHVIRYEIVVCPGFFAYRFAKHYLVPADSDEDHVPLLEPQSAGRHGYKPFMKQLSSFEEETRYIAKNLKRMHDEGMQWLDMCIVYRSRWMGEELHRALQAVGIPTQWLASQHHKKSFRPSEDSVKLMTMHSSKGLEFPLVAIPGIGFMPGKKKDLAAEAKLLYVAMTRSTEKLVLTCHEESEFVQLLAEAC